MIKKCCKCGFETEEIKKHFHKCTRLKDGFKTYCKECCKKIRYIYQNTEHGFMMNMFNTIKKKTKAARYRRLPEIEKDRFRCYITWKEFMELWENHKKIRGNRCHLTEVEIITKRSDGRKGTKYLGHSNGVSTDRLDPNIGYTKDNIIFISNEANKLKNAVTKELCIKILEIYKEKGL
jgi:hypothetical protein